MKKLFFKILNSINKKILPSYIDKDPAKLSKVQQAVLAFRYWILVQSKE